MRDSQNLPEENLARIFYNNKRINKVFDEEDPDIIANIIQEELTNIIDRLTNPRIKQVKKKNSPTL